MQKEGAKRITEELSIEMEDFVPVSPILHLNIDGLDEIGTFKHKDSTGMDYRVVQCTPRNQRVPVCPHCGPAGRVKRHGYYPKDRAVHDVSIADLQIDIVIRVPRFQCMVCEKTLHSDLPGIDDNHYMTKRLCEQIKRKSFTHTFAELAADFRVSEPTVAEIFDEYIEELEAQKEAVVAPRVLGIDEKHIVHAMRGVFVNIETGALLEMTPSNKRNDIIGAIESMEGYDERIEIVTMDMFAGYRSYVQECLPYAKIVVDKYHVFQAMHQRVKKVKTRIVDMLTSGLKYMDDPAEYERLKTILSTANRDHYLFKYSAKKLATLDPYRLMLMADLCRAFPDFNHLRLLKEKFEHIYDAETREDAEKLYEEWAELVPPRGKNQMNAWQAKYRVMPEIYAEFRSLRNTMENWKEEIFRYFDPGCRYTNAATEGINSIIERINNQGNGYSFERLRGKAIYWHLSKPEKKYMLKGKRIPVYESPKEEIRFGYMDFTHMGKMGNTPIQRDRVVGTKEELYVVEVEEEEVVRKPLSVASYIPKETFW